MDDDVCDFDDDGDSDFDHNGDEDDDDDYDYVGATVDDEIDLDDAVDDDSD